MQHRRTSETRPFHPPPAVPSRAAASGSAAAPRGIRAPARPVCVTAAVDRDQHASLLQSGSSRGRPDVVGRPRAPLLARRHTGRNRQQWWCGHTARSRRAVRTAARRHSSCCRCKSVSTAASRRVGCDVACRPGRRRQRGVGSRGGGGGGADGVQR